MVKRRNSKIMRSGGRFKAPRAVGYGSLGLLGIVALGLLFPIVHESSFATCADGTSTAECIVTRAETEPEVTVKTSLAVSMDNKATMEVVPTSKGATTIGTTNLTVATNSVDGYSLYMQSSDGLTNTSTLHEGNDLLAEKISITEQDSTLSNMKNNRYGYYLGDTAASSNTVFSALPTTNTIIKQTTSTTGSVADTDYSYGDSYVLSFGVKVGTELPAGKYSGSVTVSAVANPETVQSMAGLTYMQEMSSDICTNTREGYTKQLIDTRDGKSYWVAKLKDGNCWMTQNLAFTITQEMIENGSINSSNTDIDFTWLSKPNDDGWTAVEMFGGDGGSVTGYTYYEKGEEKYYPPIAVKSVTPTGTVNQNRVATFSWSFGKFVLATPFLSNSCEIHAGNPSGILGVVLKEGDELEELCKNSNVVDVSGSEWRPTYVAQEGTWTLADGSEYHGFVAVDLINHTYDAHYLFGNYYAYSAATAGTGPLVKTNNMSAAGSICPKGWELPRSGKTSGNQAARVDKTFYNLLLSYGYSTDDFVLNTWNHPVANIINPTTNVTTNPAAAPLYWGRSGNVSPYYGLLSNVGGALQLGSSSAYSESNEYHLVMRADAISPADVNSRDGGSVWRCVAR